MNFWAWTCLNINEISMCCRWRNVFLWFVTLILSQSRASEKIDQILSPIFNWFLLKLQILLKLRGQQWKKKLHHVGNQVSSWLGCCSQGPSILYNYYWRGHVFTTCSTMSRTTRQIEIKWKIEGERERESEREREREREKKKER